MAYCFFLLEHVEPSVTFHYVNQGRAERVSSAEGSGECLPPRHAMARRNSAPPGKIQKQATRHTIIQIPRAFFRSPRQFRRTNQHLYRQGKNVTKRVEIEFSVSFMNLLTY